MAAHIGLVTSRVLTEPDPDREPLLAALDAAGVRASLVGWDDPDAPAAETFDALLLRSCWNYPQAVSAFRAWLKEASAGTRIWNSPDTVRWNMHKQYLLEFEDAGIPIVPTRLVAQGTALDIASVAETDGWDDIVVKPAISAGSYRTKRIESEAARRPDAQQFVDWILADSDLLIQPFMESVVSSYGERNLIWIDGEFTHAVAKRARFDTDDESIISATATSDEVAFAETVLESFRAIHGSEAADALLYARADLMRDNDGQLVLSELELIEPSLFLQHAPHASQALAAALASRRLSPP